MMEVMMNNFGLNHDLFVHFYVPLNHRGFVGG